MNKTPNICPPDGMIMGSLTKSVKDQKGCAIARRRIHNHIFYYITFPSQLQEEN